MPLGAIMGSALAMACSACALIGSSRAIVRSSHSVVAMGLPVANGLVSARVAIGVRLSRLTVALPPAVASVAAVAELGRVVVSRVGVLIGRYCRRCVSTNDAATENSITESANRSVIGGDNDGSSDDRVLAAKVLEELLLSKALSVIGIVGSKNFDVINSASRFCGRGMGILEWVEGRAGIWASCRIRGLNVSPLPDCKADSIA